MPHFICTTCGTQYAESREPPLSCSICDEPRQYLKVTGQSWTTLDRLRLTHRNSITFMEAGLIGIGIDPPFAIGQRALFLRSPSGNILWDCLPLLDPAVVECLKALSGLSAIAISHPHYYSSMVEWSRAFGGVLPGRDPLRTPWKNARFGDTEMAHTKHEKQTTSIRFMLEYVPKGSFCSSPVRGPKGTPSCRAFR